MDALRYGGKGPLAGYAGRPDSEMRAAVLSRRSESRAETISAIRSFHGSLRNEYRSPRDQAGLHGPVFPDLVPLGHADPVAQPSPVGGSEEVVLSLVVEPPFLAGVAAHRAAAEVGVAGGGVHEDLDPDPHLLPDLPHLLPVHPALGHDLGRAGLLVESRVLGIDDGAPDARVDQRLRKPVLEGPHRPDVREDEVANPLPDELRGFRKQKGDLARRGKGVEGHAQDLPPGSGISRGGDHLVVVHFVLRPAASPSLRADVHRIRPCVEDAPGHRDRTPGYPKLSHRHLPPQGCRSDGKSYYTRELSPCKTVPTSD